jgi:heme-degrading monooxygenase HmoA
MSVTVIVRMKADPANLKKLFESNRNDFVETSAAGRKAGATHHHFAAGDGEVVIVDEWDTAESFQAFFNNTPVIAELMKAGGVQGEPEISIFETLDSPDRF